MSKKFKSIGHKKVKIDELKNNMFVRQALNQDHALLLGELIENGVKLPPIMITADLTIVDGRHRVEGHLLAKLTEIEVEIVEFANESEMIAAAYQANSGGSLPPSTHDREHTVGVLVDRKETINHIAELLGLPPSITRRLVSVVKSKRQRAKLMDAASAVRDDGLSVPRAAELHGVDAEDVKRTLGGKRSGKRQQQVAEIKRQMTFNYRSHGQKTAAMMRQLTDQFEDADIGQKEIVQIFDHIEQLQKKAARAVSDWKARFHVKSRPIS